MISLILSSFKKNDAIVIKCFFCVRCNLWCGTEIFQGPDDINGKRLHWRPLFLGEPAALRERAFFAQGAAFPNQTERFVITLQKQQPFQTQSPFPAAYLSGSLSAVVPVEIRAAFTAHQQQCFIVFAQNRPDFLRIRCCRRTTPVGIVVAASVPAL